MTRRDYLPVLDGDIAWVPLTRGQATLIDAADAELVSQHCWCTLGQPRTHGYAVTAVRRPDGRRTSLQMHRFIMGAQAGQHVDHHNGDTLDNRRGNLRIATHAQNQRNRHSTNHNGTSGYLGVSWHRQRRRWASYVRVNGRKYHIGLFDDPRVAATARDEWLRENHSSEFNTYNFATRPGDRQIADTFDASRILP